MAISSTVSMITARILTLARYIGAFQKYRRLKRIEGKWDYKCILYPPHQFPEGGNSHGGSCEIIFRTTLLSTQVEVQGERTWFGNFIHATGVEIKQQLPASRTWNSDQGAFMSDTKIMYQYKIDVGTIEGITSLDITINKKGLALHGFFYYIPENIEQNDPFYKILMQKTEQFGGISLKAYGEITLTRNNS